jgi:hypothetical protein
MGCIVPSPDQRLVNARAWSAASGQSTQSTRWAYRGVFLTIAGSISEYLLLLETTRRNEQMLQVLHARILADERERDIRQQLRQRSAQRDAEVANAEAGPVSATGERRPGREDRLCPDCPGRVAAPVR